MKNWILAVAINALFDVKVGWLAYGIEKWVLVVAMIVLTKILLDEAGEFISWIKEGMPYDY